MTLKLIPTFCCSFYLYIVATIQIYHTKLMTISKSPHFVAVLFMHSSNNLDIPNSLHTRSMPIYENLERQVVNIYDLFKETFGMILDIDDALSFHQFLLPHRGSSKNYHCKSPMSIAALEPTPHKLGMLIQGLDMSPKNNSPA